MSLLKNMFGTSQESQEGFKIDWRQLTDLGQLNEIINESNENPILIFKHSTRCGISRMVLRRFENEFDLQQKITPYFLDLLAHRDISNAVAKRFDVFHQSPQLIVIENGKAVYHTSHDTIEASKLEQFV